MAYKYVLELFITLSFARQIKIFVATPRLYARVCSQWETSARVVTATPRIYAGVRSQRETSARAVTATPRIYARVCSRRETSAQYDVATPIGVTLRYPRVSEAVRRAPPVDSNPPSEHYPEVGSTPSLTLTRIYMTI